MLKNNLNKEEFGWAIYDLNSEYFISLDAFEKGDYRLSSDPLLYTTESMNKHLKQLIKIGIFKEGKNDNIIVVKASRLVKNSPKNNQLNPDNIFIFGGDDDITLHFNVSFPWNIF